MADVPTVYGTLPCRCGSRNVKSVKKDGTREWSCDDCGHVFETRQWFRERRARAEARQVA